MKKFLFITSLMILTGVCYAANVTGVDSIDKTMGTAQQVIQVVARWGGIALLVSAGIIFGLGKAKGEAIGIGFYLAIGLGIIAAGFSYWGTVLGTSGFAF